MEPLTIHEREAKIRRINTLMSACRLIPNRPDILKLWDATGADELTDEALVECGQFMEAAYRGKTTAAPEPIRRLRSQAMTQINRLGLYATASDWTGVNRFLLQRKICGRLLYMLDSEDLAALIRKLRAIGDKKTQGMPGGTPRRAVVYYPLANSAGPAN